MRSKPQNPGAWQGAAMLQGSVKIDYVLEIVPGITCRKWIGGVKSDWWVYIAGHILDVGLHQIVMPLFKLGLRLGA